MDYLTLSGADRSCKGEGRPGTPFQAPPVTDAAYLPECGEGRGRGQTRIWSGRERGARLGEMAGDNGSDDGGTACARRPGTD